MSIDLNWDTVTGGADGEELALKIRDYIHERFQTITLPRFIKSVEVHAFEFGTVPPEVELKDITDPLPDFYEENSDIEDDDDDGEEGEGEGEQELEFGRRIGNTKGNGTRSRDDYGSHPAYVRGKAVRNPGSPPSPPSPSGRRKQGHVTADGLSKPKSKERVSHLPAHLANLGSAWRDTTGGYMQDLGSPFLGVSTPGIPGGTSNMHYFHSHFNSSGTQTPLAAVAGAQHLGTSNNNPPGHPKYPGPPSVHPPSPTPNSMYMFPPDERSMPRSRSRGRRSFAHSRHPSQGSVSAGEHSVPPGLGLTAAQQQQQQQRSISPSISSFAVGTPPPHHNHLLAISQGLREKHSVSTLAPTSIGTSRPPTRDAANILGFTADGGLMSQIDGSGIYGGSSSGSNGDAGQGRSGLAGVDETADQQHPSRFREPRIEDLQAVFRIRYAGDVRLLLMANILLDYPMPSFVGIPVQLSITGMTFDGVGVLAKIRQRLHFCFLSPEDAAAAVGPDEDDGDDGAAGDAEAHKAAPGDPDGSADAPASPHRPVGAPPNAQSPISPGPRSPVRIGGLLQEIRVESEIGQRESGKQSLKNVGKVERFVLEQVRRIFEDELVYPSFWTFLV